MTFYPAKTKASVETLRTAFGSPARPMATVKEQGRRLATMPRGDGQEMRLSLDTFEGRPYLALRLWMRTEEGLWVPTKKGCSIRLREIPDLMKGLMTAAEEARLIAEREGGDQ